MKSENEVGKTSNSALLENPVQCTYRLPVTTLCQF